MREICRTTLFVISEYVRAADKDMRSCDDQTSRRNPVVVVGVLGAEAAQQKKAGFLTEP